MTANSTTITQLYTQNLVPVYLLEEKLKNNFIYIQGRLDSADATVKLNFESQQSQNVRLNNQLASIQDVLATIQPLIERRVEDKIMQALGLAISSKISEYYDKAASNEQTILRAIQDKVNRKSNQLKADLKVQITRDTEAMLNNQLTDFRKTIRTTLEKSTASAYQYAPGTYKPSAQASNGQTGSSQKQRQLSVKLQQQQEAIDDLRKKLDKAWDLTQTLERESYNHQTQLGQHIKSVMDMLQDYKTCNNKNIQNFKIEFFRLKNSKSIMEGAKLDKVDDIFKSNLLASLDDITKNMTTMLPRTEFEQLHMKSLNKTIVEHQQQLTALRKQLVRQEQIMAYTNQLSQGLEGFQAQLNERFEALTKIQITDRNNFATSLQPIMKNIEFVKEQTKELSVVDEGLGKRIDEHRLDLMKMPLLAEQIKLLKVRTTQLQRICSYEDHMDEIQDVLDKQFVIPPEGAQQPKMRRRGGVDQARLASVQSQLAEWTNQVKVEIEQIKLLQAKRNELHEVWKAINILETRLEILKGDDEAASAAKKQWTCLSCERNVEGAQGKPTQHKNWDAVPMKKLHPLQSGGFGQKQASSKNIKPIIPQQRPEKVERVREKYFSDTVKLPDILQDRLQQGGSRQFRL